MDRRDGTGCDPGRDRAKARRRAGAHHVDTGRGQQGTGAWLPGRSARPTRVCRVLAQRSPALAHRGRIGGHYAGIMSKPAWGSGPVPHRYLQRLALPLPVRPPRPEVECYSTKEKLSHPHTLSRLPARAKSPKILVMQCSADA
ncbi:hypothetical protein CBM2586_A10962 [Cupriavidus phytorum]|uniref:Uncharacterized protein n=1 Tax=Cupriavidus taiwanensis TaxID=164546 RepID=A0A975WR95_9BURK|nr:hypothetical protein CBM2586_A10962 [Cupriavidus taiwanensis]